MSPKLGIIRACPRNSYQLASRLTDPPSKQTYQMHMNGFRLETRKMRVLRPQRPVRIIEKVGVQKSEYKRVCVYYVGVLLPY